MVQLVDADACQLWIKPTAMSLHKTEHPITIIVAVSVVFVQE